MTQRVVERIVRLSNQSVLDADNTEGAFVDKSFVDSLSSCVHTNEASVCETLGDDNIHQSDDEVWCRIDSLVQSGMVPSSDDDCELEIPGSCLREELAEWAVSCNIAHSSLTKLLKILRGHNMDVPNQASTLLQTPRKLTLKKKSGGDYYYFGLEQCIKQALLAISLNEIGIIELKVSIDGLPIFKSKNQSLWPIQCSIASLPQIKPFVVALYFSDHKPHDYDFLEDFINELKHLMTAGFFIESDPSRAIPVKVHCIICDAPARALVKGMVQFNGFYGCDYCDVRGEYDGRMMFLELGQGRTDSSFRNKSNPEHHKSNSPFLHLDLDMIQTFPIDPMHAIDLGVVKRLLLLWKEGPRETRLSAGQMSVISAYLHSVRPFMPPFFNRKPRGLDEVKMWKATEFQTFLMYIGPIVLKGILPTKMYTHFMCLSVSVCILYNSKLVELHQDYAHRLLLHFIEESKLLYGKRFVSYNVHSLFHMAGIARKFKFGTLLCL